MKKVYLFLFLSFFSFSGFAQTAASYTFTALTGTYTDISGTGTSVSSIYQDDYTQNNIPIGFTFSYCGAPYTQLSASSNMFLSLANGLFASGYYSNGSGGMPSSGVGMLMPYWDDGYGYYSTAYYQTTGSSGSKVFTFEWNNWEALTFGGAINMQVKLYEGSNMIEFVYGSNSFYYSASATIGIANGTGSGGYQTLNNASSSPTSSTSFNTSISTFPANGQIYRYTNGCSGTPTAGSISAGAGTVTSCSSFTTTLTLSGQSALPGISTQWQSSTTSASSGFTNISGATGTTYAATASSPGTTWYRNNVTCATSGLSAATTAIALTLNATPTAFNVTGGGGICVGGADIHIGLNGSTSGVNYQLKRGATNVGSAVSGTGSPIDFGVFTTDGTYTVSATNPTTTCANAMSGSAVIFTNAVTSPISGTFTVCGGLTTALSDATPGGAWSSSDFSRATIGSSGIVTGGIAGNPVITYTPPSGCAVTAILTVNPLAAIGGTPSLCVGSNTTLTDAASGGVWSSGNTAIVTVGSGGLVTAVGIGSTNVSYSFPSTGCTATITAFVTTIPTVFTVSGGGSRCPGGNGVLISLNGSNAGVSYQLMNGAYTVGAPITGSGLSIAFPLDTAGGTYGVIANPGSDCQTTMGGSAVVTVLPAPTAFTVSGGGGFCSGGAGPHIYLSSSTIGVNYQLFRGLIPAGSLVSGTGASIDFGVFTSAGVYTVGATNVSTGCVSTMSGSVTVSINPLPTASTVTPIGGGGYCTGSGGSVIVGLNGSVTGTNYQLLLAGSPVGAPVAGTNLAITFGAQSTPGVYTVLATTTATGCTATMSGSTTVSVNPLPSTFTITGGGNYCVGGTGVSLGLNGSSTGVNYQLWKDAVAYTPTTIVAGTGAAISFGSTFTLTGSYTVVATNPSTGCTLNMSGSAAVGTNPLPVAASLTGGGSICAGSAGIVVGLGSSVAGTNYQLINGGIVGGASGTGFPITFGLQTSPGTYTVLATIAATGCSTTFASSVNIVVNPQPLPFSVTAEGAVGASRSYCAGGTGVHIGLNGSTSGVSYQLYNAGIPSGPAVSGTGISLDLGLRTLAGPYTAIATTGAGCTSNMTGSASISINPLPVIYNVTGGGGYCSGTVTGVHIGLAASNVGINYQLQNGGPIGAPVPGGGSAIDFGTFTAAGTYTVLATNTTTSCTNTMSGSAAVSVNGLPAIFAMTSNGSYCLGGTGVPVGIGGSTTGITYQLYRGGSPVSALAGTGAALSFGNQTTAGTYTIIATNPVTGCSSSMAGSTTVGINPLPTVYTITGGGGYCSGGTGINVGLSASSVGTTYQLYSGFAAIGLPVAGTGSGISFGLQTAAGNYTATATTNPPNSCSINMSGVVAVSINPLPTLYLVTGGGNYCAGGTGMHVGLSGSSVGTNYQMYMGLSPVGITLAGTGSSLDFGTQTAAGVYTIAATNATTGCFTNMIGTAIIAVTPLPTAYNVTGGGNHCPGGIGVPVNLSGSASGNTYQLYLGPVAVGDPVTGTGLGITLGLQTATGNYTVVATNTLSTCSAPMAGSATVGLYPVPLAYNVTGGGNYCSGGTGVMVGTDGSSTGNTYQISVDGVPSGSPVAGTGLPVSFGLQTTTGSYTITALNPTTGCTSNMTGSVAVGLNTLPFAYTVTGGGDYCQGSGGLAIGLSGSETATSYQLFKGAASTGPSMAGTGSALTFAAQTLAGSYTIVATSSTTGCKNTMSGSVPIVVDPLPTTHTVTGGGNYCSGGTGVNVGLNTSESGIYYQLYNAAIPTGPTVSGTGSAISFGPQTLAGVYTVVATNSATGCKNNMTGSVTVTINGLPTAYHVTGGGNYCPGGAGVAVGTSGSNSGINYQLKRDGAIIGAPVAGTGLPVDFGLQTLTGTYTVVATNSVTGCNRDMTDSVVVGISSLPASYSIYGAHSNYCAGGIGVPLTLSGSESGVNYQLYVGGMATGAPYVGTGYILDLGLQTTAGNYTIVATNVSTTCTSVMSGSFSVAIDPLPTPYSVIGGGEYCSGGAGVLVGLNNSHIGISYQLYNGATLVGSAQPGTGSPISFGNQTAAGSYTVIAKNTTSSCVNNMSGGAVVAIDPLPTVYTVTGTGNYCAGAGGLHVTLTGSNTGITYQLYKDGALTGGPATGTGLSIDFGAQTASGSYTVKATNATTGCIADMAGSAVIGINPLPAAFTVSGGGNFCAGADGVHVGLLGSATGITYQLYNGAISAGAPAAGTGSVLDFGLKTASGTYTVVATNTSTMCMNNMSGSVVININPLPAAHNVIGGGNYCTGTDGVHIGLDGSNSDIQYQLFIGATPMGSPAAGTGSLLDFGLFTTNGTYTAVATNAVTGCVNHMPGTATVAVASPVTPSITLSSATTGDTLCAGNLAVITALVANQGTTPVYHWTVNGTGVPSVSTSYTYMPADGDVVTATLTSNAACATPATVSGSLNLSVLPNGAPAVSITADPATAVCQGTVVNFSTTGIMFGGNASFTWLVNGINQNNDDHYGYIPQNGDDVYVVMNSSYKCRTANSTASNHIVVNVDVPVIPDVTVTADPGANFAMGQMVTLTAVINNSVTAPSYQWLVNGTPVLGANMATFKGNNFSNNDSVSCAVTSGGSCAGSTGAGALILHVGSVGVNQVAATGGDIILVPNPNKGQFTVKGTLGANNDQEVSIEITNLLGQAIYTSKVMTHGGNINEKIQIGNNIANGMYILNLHSENENKVFHLVIEQ